MKTVKHPQFSTPSQLWLAGSLVCSTAMNYINERDLTAPYKESVL